MLRIALMFGVALLLDVARTLAFTGSGTGPQGEAAWAQEEASKWPLPLKVDKTHVVNSKNERVHLHGVNAASLEWTSDGEGHILDTAKVATSHWHANIVRLPLSQDRWFGKAPEQQDEGKAYRRLVQQIVDTCAGRGCYVMLDLHWSDAGLWGKNIGQHVMPDRNSLAFWKELAMAYKNHPAVLFDLYNEPHDVSWEVWRNGGTVTEKNRRTRTELTFEAVGIPALLAAVRETGANNVVVVGGLDWAYDMSGFLDLKQLADPKGNGVIYANHAYPNKGDTVEKWIVKLETASKEFPIIVSEFGSEARGPASAGPRSEQWVRQVLVALHDHDWDWTAWDLHPRAGPRLISDWNYTPTTGFGVLVKDALAGKYPGKDQSSSSPSPIRPVATAAPLTLPSPPAAGGEGRVRGLGIFESHGDVGTVLHAGSAKYDAIAKAYTLSGSGENMWSAKDAFHFAWTKLTGDVSLAADISFLGTGREPHRKACLMIRQDLDADAAYVDVAVHGDGLTSLQFRDTKGAATHEVQTNVSAPARVQLVKRGKYALLYLATPLTLPSPPTPGGEGRVRLTAPSPPTPGGEGRVRGKELRFSGAAVRVTFEGPFYVGLGVCAHNKDVTETAVFSNTELSTTFSPPSKPPILYSTLETQILASTDRRVVYVTPSRIEAPNWLRGGKTLIYNSGGRIYRMPVAGGKPEAIDTGFATRCNNDHGVSPDGNQLVISDQSQGDRKSRIYTLPVTGGSPKLITTAGPSYWHGWSPDGKTLAYCAERNGEFDVYTIPAAGGPETRLTTAKGLDDGPEYSPDGRYIYFNSDRTGRMHIWRMKIDSTEQEQITEDEYNNWFPHPAPDGRVLVFLSYEKDVIGHPPNKDVTLRRLTLANKKIDVLGRFFGGQGTINVPCWSPDGRRIAFVSYQLVP